MKKTITYIIHTEWKDISEGKFWRLDATKLDVSQDELMICILEQFYSGVEI